MVSAPDYRLGLYADPGNPTAAANRIYSQALATRVDLVRTMDMGGKSRAVGSTSSPALSENRQEYANHLAGKFWTAHFVLMICGAVAGVFGVDLLMFYLEGTAIIHPLLSIFMLVAVCSLAVVASISIRTTMRYYRRIARAS